MKRIPELDGLRGISAVGIVLLHQCLSHFFFFWSGVDLFFVISGYLITGIILRERHSPGFFTRFYVRRSLRIWPTYYLCLAIVFALERFGRFPVAGNAFVHCLTFTQHIQNYWSSVPTLLPRAFAQTWTLAIEEQFYLLWPILLFFVPKKYASVTLGIIILASVVARSSGMPSDLLLGRADGLALGSLLAVKFEGTPRAALERDLWAVVCLCLAYFGFGAGWEGATFFAAFPVNSWATVFVFNVFFCGIVGLAVLHSGAPWLAVLRIRPLRYLGKISYGIYLYHLLVFWVIDAGMMKDPSFALPWHSLGWESVRWSLCLLIPALSWRWIEEPLMDLKPTMNPFTGKIRARASHAPDAQ
jgi:peptidoglycan/LPS O-acetylase OafA/YrhL